MLASLTIRNFVLIEDATLEFGPGLAVLTGETGAGKTLLTRALGLLMGERAEDGLVGGAAEEAYIQADRASRASTLMVVVGTSAIVYPAASMPLIAKQSGAAIIEVNPEPTPLTAGVSSYLIRGGAGEVMNRIVAGLENPG